MNRFRVPTALACLCLTALAGAAHAATSAGGPVAKPPRIVEFEYSEDYEGFGRHHNMFATLKGVAERVTARSGELKSEGKLEEVAGPQAYWNFRDRDFVRGMLEDLHADGAASVTVKAVGETRTVRKRCDLVLDPDDEFGDYASGPCERL